MGSGGDGGGHIAPKDPVKTPSCTALSMWLNTTRGARTRKPLSAFFKLWGPVGSSNGCQGALVSSVGQVHSPLCHALFRKNRSVHILGSSGTVSGELLRMTWRRQRAPLVCLNFGNFGHKLPCVSQVQLGRGKRRRQNNSFLPPNPRNPPNKLYRPSARQHCIRGNSALQHLLETAPPIQTRTTEW